MKNTDLIEERSKEIVDEFIGSVIDIIDRKFKKDERMQRLKELLLEDSKKIKILTEIFAPEYRDYPKEAAKSLVPLALQREYYSGDSIDTQKIIQKLENTVLVFIPGNRSKRLDAPDVCESDLYDVEGYASKIARLFRALEKANFLDFNPLEHWGRAFLLLAKDCNDTQSSVSKNANNWKEQYFKKGKPLTTIGGRNYCLLVETAKTLSFAVEKWEENDFLSDDELEKIVKKYKSKYLASRNLKLDFKRFKAYLPPAKMKQVERDMLRKLSGDLTPEKLAELLGFGGELKRYLDGAPSDSFLMELLKIFYERGYYQEANVYLLDKIASAKIKADLEYNLLVAHIYGSVGKYHDAIKILRDLDTKDQTELADIMTSLVSNLLRGYLHDTLQYDSRLGRESEAAVSEEVGICTSKIKKEDLHYFVDYYRRLFEESKHYYPGINYAYMYSLVHLLYEKSLPIEITEYIKEIYHGCQTSIRKDSRRKDSYAKYYAAISEIEFCALMDEGERVDELYAGVLDVASDDMLYRSYRQVRLYLDLLEHCGVSSIPSAMRKLADKLKSTIEGKEEESCVSSAK